MTMTAQGVRDVAETSSPASQPAGLGTVHKGRPRQRYHTLTRVSDGKIYELRETNHTQNAFAVRLQP